MTNQGAPADGSIDLSVIIPAYNAADTISAQLDALLAQTWPGGLEVIVADNGSSDRTRAIVSEHADRLRPVRLVDAAQRRGPSHARNIGAANAHGALIAFCDADDIVGSGWLVAIANALQRSPATTGPLELTHLNAPWLQSVYGTRLASEAQSFAGIFRYGASANLGIRRAVFTELGGFDESIEIGEDIDFCFRLWRAGHQLEFVPDAVVHYRLRQTTRALWRQAIRYGMATPQLVKRFSVEGQLIPGRLRGVRNWLWLIRNLPVLRHQQGRARWVVVLGGATGRLIGSVRHAVLYV